MKKLKWLAGLAFVLNTFLFGSYYSFGKGMLGRIDPIVFTFFTMMTLVPVAICILIFSRRHMTRDAVKSGFLLGTCLCLGLFSLAVALKYNSATGTAFFPSLNGLLAAIFTWLFLRQPISKATWFAGIVSVTGAILLMANASMGGARGAIIAFIGGMLCTFYVFLADHEQRDQAAYWPLFGVELLTMALWANLLALLFGDWHMVHIALPQDLGVIAYIGLGTIFLPTLFTVLLQKYISPVTVSFIYILEPIFGAIVAYLYLHEVLPLDGYLGGFMVVAGVLIHTWGTVERPGRRLQGVTQQTRLREPVQPSWLQSFMYPLILCILGACLVAKMGGFPPVAWQDLYQSWPLLDSQLQGPQRMDAILLLAQSLSWLIAWFAIITMGILVCYRVSSKLFSTAAPTAAVDGRSIRQMGYTPYVPVVQPTRPHSIEASEELYQQRRLHRRVRLAHIEPHDDEIYEAPTHVPGRRTIVTRKQEYSETLSDRWPWGGEHGAREARK
ncbi:hypothetical protein KDA_66090 [Dictyobacter alpinus]|uniref:EamA domain-containing protein n=1 Tax=Dictyobacter alpinus TaxID=2014873 RepID=A0A402BID0_9CHLR|nr:DMT family transporter [Dictyobacter alpinus]GCE31125.1 hypothetical protein KDA_66090 [Dictyobacter alpinus]